MKLTKIPMPPETYKRSFRRPNGMVKTIAITEKEFQSQRGVLKIPQPTDLEGVWFQDWSGYEIPPGTYAVENGEQYIINDGLGTFPMKKEFVDVNGIFSQEGKDKIKKAREL